MWENFWSALLPALALVFIIEGMMPFLNPRGWRASLLLITKLDDRTIRSIGFFSMLFGLIFLYLVH